MTHHSWITRHICYWLCAVLVVGAPAVVSAQQNNQATAEPTDKQLELNAEAVGAITEGEYTKAVELLERANDLGQFNVTWLNLGRAYQKMGECDKARQAYLNVISAPAVKDPSPRLINAKADQYLGELDSECDAKESGVKVAGGDTETSEADKGVDEQEGPEDGSSEQGSIERESSNGVGWTLTATGVVLAGAGVGAHFYAESIRDDVRTSIDAANGGVVAGMSRQEALDDQARANTLDTVGVSAIAVGAVVTGTGVFLLLSSDDVEAAPTASVTAGGDFSVGFTGRF